MRLRLDASDEELRVFLQEAEEQLDLLDADILTLERGERGSHLLQEMFRAAHTLKGSSAALGHERMASLMHALENVLDRLRQGTVSVSTELVDTLLDCLDALRGLKEELVHDEESSVSVDGLVGRLRLLAEGQAEIRSNGANPDPGMPSAMRELAYERISKGDPIHLVVAQIDPTCPLPAARCMQVYLALESLGEILNSSPSLEVIEAGAPVTKMLVLLLAEDAASQAHGLLQGIPDVTSVEVESFDEQSAAALQNYWATKESSTPPAMGSGDRSDASSVDLAAKRLAESAKTVRIDVERLDNLINLVGELVIDRTRLSQLHSLIEERHGSSDLMDKLEEAIAHLARVTDDLQLETMKSRLVPIESVFAKFPRLVRDVAQRAGKQITFVVRGEHTELDRSVVQELGDPLIHILRNAVDHGIEPVADRLERGKPEAGQVELAAGREENHIVITVTDDGRGIDSARMRQAAIDKGLLTAEAAERLTDAEATDLIFVPGFSTSQTVSELSGRGVGMDIVRTNIERLNGSVFVETRPGAGTKFVIRLPLTLAIMPALLVGVEEEVFAIPLASVVETLRIDRSQVSTIGGHTSAITLRGRVLPVLSLRQLLDMPSTGNHNGRTFVVAARHGGLQIGLQVDYLEGQQEIVVKPLGNYLGDVAGIAGATILGDGRVALIVDIPGLVRVCLAGRK